MKKILLVLSIVFFLGSCDDLITDLLATDTAMYLSGNTVSFPKNTKALDIYNTVVSIYPDNEWHNVTGGWKHIKTDKDSDGLIVQTWETIPFTKIKNIHAIK